jgi:hypothetical protein
MSGILVAMTTHFVLAIAASIALGDPVLAQQAGGHAQHLDARGKQVMGFDQQKTTHHFLLYEDGGAIEVTVKDRADEANLDAIRQHLPHIVQLFSDGDFSSPMLVHDRKDVPGTNDLARLKARLKYAYVQSPSGGRVEIVTADKDALAALHAFLRFQIEDHHTGDKTVPVRRPRLP